MPVDLKRINGPENTVSYKLYTPSKTFKEELKCLFKSNNKRQDGRNSLEHRKMFIKTGIVSQAKGSAYLELGNTKVIVSVFDPREIPNKTDYSQKGVLYCEFKYATFSCPQRRNFQQDSEEKQNSIILKQSLEPAVCLHEFPNFQVDIYALILENDGSSLSAAVTCACVALAHASVPMYDLVTAVTMGVVDNQILMDPTLKEQQLCEVFDETDTKSDHGIIVTSFMSTHQQISQFYQTGNINLENISKSISISTDASGDIKLLIEKCIVNHVLKGANKSNEE
ncbi:PREDICTED: exosome complex component MTR3-like [Nicrophorus vespilloides]|uniref:Exosome complex component MTR3-like n=1 Tax=Nicrophorus vespilloides TaxID=110193 RepID=A0ABM1MBJ5_NICVS|nr:PREDICTED: exosome complex component MTR3-like [Nicrophorus vespilloides]